MPPRRRNQPRPPRAGARPGALSDEVRTALGEEVARLERIEEPAARSRAVGDLFAALDTELAAIAQVRYKAVREMRSDLMSYQRIADASGLSKGRVAQILKDPRLRRRV